MKNIYPIAILCTIVGSLVYFTQGARKGAVEVTKSPQNQANKNSRAITDLVKYIYDGMKNDGNAIEVKRRFTIYENQYGMNSPMISYDLGEFFLKHKMYEDAYKHLDYVLKPTNGTKSTLEKEGSTLIMWIEAASHIPNAEIEATINLWASKQKVDTKAKMSPLALAYYKAARQMESMGTQDSMKKAIQFYKRSTELAPNSSLAWADLGFAKEFIGDTAGAKQARLKAYQVADLSDKPRLQKSYRLTASDIAIK